MPVRRSLNDARPSRPPPGSSVGVWLVGGVLALVTLAALLLVVMQLLFVWDVYAGNAGGVSRRAVRSQLVTLALSVGVLVFLAWVLVRFAINYRTGRGTASGRT